MDKQWSTINRYFVLSLLIMAGVWFVVSASSLMGALLIAALIAYVLDPLVSLVHDRARLPRQLSVPLVYIAVIALLVTLVVLVLPLLPEGTTSAVAELTVISDQIEEFVATPVIVLGFELPLDEMVTELRAISADMLSADLIFDYARSASANLAWILIIVVTIYYLLLDWGALRDWLLNLAPPAHQSDARRLYTAVRDVWSRYLRGQLLLMFVIGMLTWLSLVIIGLPGAVAIGLLAGILDVILSVGPAIAMVTAAIVALVSGSTYLPISNIWMVAIVLAIFAAIQMAENIWLRPRVLGHSLHLHPAVVFIAVIGALTMAGVLVALIIIPVLGSFAIIGRYLYARIIGLDPWGESAADEATT